MIYRTVPLWDKAPEATLTEYLCDNSPEIGADPFPAVIVCPGGGYHFLSDREAEPIAAEFFARRMNTYVLRYSLSENASEYRPLIEAALAIKYVREHAEEEHTDPKKIFICGFSAGGHLAASAGVLWNIQQVRDAVGVTDGSAPEGINRPDGMILSYAVLTAKPGYTHLHTIQHVVGKENPTEEESAPFSIERHVDKTTPPAFIWHTFTDDCVPIQNALFMMDALAKEKIPFEAHIYPEGPHGLALSDRRTWRHSEKMNNPHVAGWIDLSIKWIEEQF